jgi:hypothetical protein
MKPADNALHQAYLTRMIAQGKYVEIAVPESRGNDDWNLLERQHSKERSRKRDMSLIVPKSQYIVPTIKAASGLIALFAIEQPQPNLFDSEILPAHLSTPIEIARRTAISLETMKVKDHNLAVALKNDSSILYDALVEIAGSEVELKNSLKRLKRFKAHGLNVQTIDNHVSFEPEKIIAKSVQTGLKLQATLTYIGLAQPVRGEVMVMLNLVAKDGTSHQQLTRLNTLNNQRALKLLQAAQLMDFFIQAEMSQEFDLWTTRWIFNLVAVINEEDLIDRMGPVGTYIHENF